MCFYYLGNFLFLFLELMIIYWYVGLLPILDRLGIEWLWILFWTEQHLWQIICFCYSWNEWVTSTLIVILIWDLMTSLCWLYLNLLGMGQMSYRILVIWFGSYSAAVCTWWLVLETGLMNWWSKDSMLLKRTLLSSLGPRIWMLSVIWFEIVLYNLYSPILDSCFRF